MGILSGHPLFCFLKNRPNQFRNTPQKLHRRKRFASVCHGQEGGMAGCSTCGGDMKQSSKLRQPAFVQPLSSFGARLNQIALGFIQSAEYGLRGRTNSEYVEDLYDAILRRGALPSEVSYWVTFLNTATREDALQYFTDSPKWKAYFWCMKFPSHLSLDCREIHSDMISLRRSV